MLANGVCMSLEIHTARWISKLVVASICLELWDLCCHRARIAGLDIEEYCVGLRANYYGLMMGVTALWHTTLDVFEIEVV